MDAFWIVDINGVHALVDAAGRELWTLVRGWRDAAEPGPQDHVWATNGDLPPGRLPYGALAEGMALLGWEPGPPPEPVDLTRDPAPAPVASDKSPAVTGPTKKEQADG